MHVFLVVSALVVGGAGVVVPTGRPTTLVIKRSPRVTVPAGRFVMGASNAEIEQAKMMCEDELVSGGALLAELPTRCGTRFDNEGTEAEVVLPAFAIDRTEVTVGAYAVCVKSRACRPPLDVSLLGDERLPVERVTWDEAQEYCRAQGGRLPSEAEWEKAARGPLPRAFPWGADWLPRRANHGRTERLGPPLVGTEQPTPFDDGDGFRANAPVGSFPSGASPYGVLDMAGNVWEWTADVFSLAPPQITAHIAPLGPSVGPERTVRGGSHRSPPSDLRVTRRLGLPPNGRHAAVGFRCVYDLPAKS